MRHMKNKMLGCLYGQAIGDALGFASEAMSKKDVINNYSYGITRYSDIIQDKRKKGRTIGWWTDDKARFNARFSISDILYKTENALKSMNRLS